MSDPIFYRKPVALSVDAHGAKRFRHLSDYGFARDSNAVPVGAGEMASAARHYPLVFAATAPVGIVAILGIETGKNLFVDAAGKWAAELYVPAFVRRYPFAFAEREDKLILCIDEAAEALREDEGQYLFNADGTTTPFLDKVVEFNREFHTQARVTMAFAAAADAHGLLTNNRAEIETRGGRKAVLGGFRVIDRAKYDALPDDVFLEWRKAGWLDLAAAHFLSMESWRNLLSRT